MLAVLLALAPLPGAPVEAGQDAAPEEGEPQAPWIPDLPLRLEGERVTLALDSSDEAFARACLAELERTLGALEPWTRAPASKPELWLFTDAARHAEAAERRPGARPLFVPPRLAPGTRAALGLHPRTRVELAAAAVRTRLPALGEDPLSSAFARAAVLAAGPEDATWSELLRVARELTPPPSVSLWLAGGEEADPGRARALGAVLAAWLAAEHPAAVRRALERRGQAGEGPEDRDDGAPELGALLAEELGPELLAAADRAFAGHLAESAPVWVEVAPWTRAEGARWIQVAEDEADAVSWRVAPLSAGARGIAGSVTVHEGAGRAGEVYLGLEGGGYLALTLEAGFGVTLWEVRDPEAGRRRVGSFRDDALRAGEPAEFALSFADALAVLELSGRTRLRVPAPGLALTGTCGVGARAGSAVVWSGIRAVED